MANLIDIINSIDDPAFAPLLEKRKPDEIATYLNARAVTTIDNPAPQEQVFPGFRISNVFRLLNRKERGFFSKAPTLNDYLQTAYADLTIDEKLIEPLALKFIDQATGELHLLTAIKTLVETQDRETLGALATLMATRKDLSSTSVQGLTAMLATTVPDPNWTPTIEQREPSILEREGLPPATEITVQMALVLPAAVVS